MNLRGATFRLLGLIAALSAPFAAALAQPVYGPVDDSAPPAQVRWDGEVATSATYARRDRELVSDYDRSGLGASARAGIEFPAGTTVFRLEGRAETDKYTTSYGGGAEVRVQLAANITASVEAGGTKHALVLESEDADQAALRAGVEIKTGQTTLELYGRKRWRKYNDFAGGTSDGEQAGARVRQRFGPYHWLELGGYREHFDDGGGRHGYRRTALSFDYSRPVAKRVRVLLGADYRAWTYQGRWIDDIPTNPRRHDRLIRPEAGLALGKQKGLHLRATAGYDFYRSNDPRYSGNGPRLRLRIGYRF